MHSKAAANLMIRPARPLKACPSTPVESSSSRTGSRSVHDVISYPPLFSSSPFLAQRQTENTVQSLRLAHQSRKSHRQRLKCQCEPHHQRGRAKGVHQSHQRRTHPCSSITLYLPAHTNNRSSRMTPMLAIVSPSPQTPCNSLTNVVTA